MITYDKLTSAEDRGKIKVLKEHKIFFTMLFIGAISIPVISLAVQMNMEFVSSEVKNITPIGIALAPAYVFNKLGLFPNFCSTFVAGVQLYRATKCLVEIEEIKGKTLTYKDALLRVLLEVPVAVNKTITDFFRHLGSYI